MSTIPLQDTVPVVINQPHLPVSVFTNSRGPLTKTLSLDANSQLIKQPGGSMTEGQYCRTTVIGLQELDALLSRLEKDQAVAYGVAAPCYAPIVTERKFKAGGYVGIQDDPIPRTRKFFRWPQGPGVMMLDYDPPDDGSHPLSRELLYRCILAALPALNGVGMLWRPSTSSCIANVFTGQSVQGIAGQRLYLAVENAADIERVGEILAKRLWLAGFGWIKVTKAGHMLPRCPVDTTVWQPERLDFAAGAVCHLPLDRRPVESWHWPGGVLQTLLVVDLTAEEEKRYKDLVKAQKAEASGRAMEAKKACKAELKAAMASRGMAKGLAGKAAERAITNGVLSGSFPLQLDNYGLVTVAEVLDDPEKYDGETLADPLEPEYGGGRNIAVLYVKQKDPKLFSQAHGGLSYKLEDDYATHKSLEGVGEGDVEDFWADLQSGKFIHRPTGALYPASSVNRHVAPPDDLAKDESIADWIGARRGVNQITWAPGEPEIIKDKIMTPGGWEKAPGQRVYNLYRPPLLGEGDPTKAGHWRKHLETLYGAKVAEHIIRWMAHLVQRPEIKINHAIVLGGPPGIGKDTLLAPIIHGVGPANVGECTPGDLLKPFNPWVQSVLLRVSEARDLGGASKYAVYEHTKTYIAAPPETLEVNIKNVPQYRCLNRCGVLLTTNHKLRGLYLPPDDRRHYVAWSDVGAKEFPKGYFDGLWDWYKEGGLDDVVAYLQELDISAFNPAAPPPKTQVFCEIVEAQRDPVERDLLGALEQLGDPVLVIIRELADYARTSGCQELATRLTSSGMAVPNCMDSASYERHVNPNRKDGCWMLTGRRETVYARRGTTATERQQVWLKKKAEPGGSPSLALVPPSPFPPTAPDFR